MGDQKWHRGDGYGPAPTVGDDGRVLGYSIIEVARYIHSHTLPGPPREVTTLMALAGEEPSLIPWTHARLVLATLYGAAEILELADETGGEETHSSESEAQG